MPTFTYLFFVEADSDRLISQIRKQNLNKTNQESQINNRGTLIKKKDYFFPLSDRRVPEMKVAEAARPIMSAKRNAWNKKLLHLGSSMDSLLLGGVSLSLSLSTHSLFDSFWRARIQWRRREKERGEGREAMGTRGGRNLVLFWSRKFGVKFAHRALETNNQRSSINGTQREAGQKIFLKKGFLNICPLLVWKLEFSPPNRNIYNLVSKLLKLSYHSLSVIFLAWIFLYIPE